MSTKRSKSFIHERGVRVAIACLLSVAMTFSGFTPQAIAEGIEELTQEATVEQPAPEPAEDEQAQADNAATEQAPASEQAEPEPEPEPEPEVTSEPEAEPEPAEEPTEESEQQEQEPAVTPDDPAASDEGEEPAVPAEDQTEDEASTEESAEEETESEEEAEEEELSYPAFNQSKSVNGVRVNVRAGDGVFPEGAKLSVKTVSAATAANAEAAVDELRDTTREVATSYVFDIKVLDKDGTEVQPKDASLVRVSFKTDEVADSALSTEVFHIDDATGAAQPLDVTERGTVAQVMVDGFSIYVITFAADGETVETIDSNPGTVVTYEFYNGSTLVQSQDIKAGDTLYEPSTPTTNEHQVFTGWYIGSTKIDFNAEGKYTVGELATATDGKVRVDAQFDDYYYLTFLNQDGKVFTRVGVKAGESIEEDKLPTEFITKHSTEALAGWSETEGCTTPVTFPITANADKTYYPIIEEGHTIHFYNNRANFPGMHKDDSIPGTRDLSIDYTVPQVVAPGGKSVKPADPTCESSAYTFEGWYTDPACTNRYTFGQELDADLDLYANWTVGQTTYKVVVYTENTDRRYDDASRNSLDPSYYDYYKSYTYSADVLERVSLPDNHEAYNVDAHFLVPDYGKPEAAVVLPDGSTELKVYWNRETRTIKFYIRNKTETSGKNWYLMEPSAAYPDLVGLYGQSFDVYNFTWPSNVTWIASNDSEISRKVESGNTYAYLKTNSYTAIRMLGYFTESAAAEYYGWDSYSGAKTTYYILQNSDGTWSETTDKTSPTSGKALIKYKENLFPNFTQVAYSDGSYAAEGSARRIALEVGESIPSLSTAADRYIYFERSKFTLEFYSDASTKAGEQKVYFDGAPDQGAIPQLEESEERHIWGWSYNPGETDPAKAIDWNTFRMPDHNVRVYPMWADNQVKVTFDLGADDAEPLNSAQNNPTWLRFGQVLDMTYLNDVQRSGYVLDGWYMANGNQWQEGFAAAAAYCDKDGSEYKRTYDETHHNYAYEMTLTAHWREAAEAKIRYADTDIPDSDIYIEGGTIKVSETIPEASAGKSFIGWLDNQGVIHKPGETFTFTDMNLTFKEDGQFFIKLTPVYVNDGAPTATITYNANYPSGATGTGTTTATDGPLAFNARVKLKGVDAFSCNGYALDGWGNTPGDKDYELNANVVVDDVIKGTNDNTLYGHWVAHTHDWTYTADGATITATCGNADGGHVGDPVTLTLSASNHVEYDRNPHPFNLSGLEEFNTATGLSVSSGDIVYSKKNGSTYEQIADVPTESGIYKASITVGEATAELQEIFIDQRQVADCKYFNEDLSYTYDGGSHIPSTRVVDRKLDNFELVKDQDYTVEIRKVGDSGDFDSWELVTNPTDAGTYQIRINGVGNWCGSVTSTNEDHHYRFTIAKADSTVPANGDGLTDAQKPTAKTGLVYNTQEQELVTAPTTKPEGVDHVEYSLDGGTTWTTELPTGKAAGDYTVTVKYVGDANHEDVVLDQAIPVTIAKADITPTVAIEGWTYGEHAKTPSVSNNPGNGAVTYEYKLADALDTAYSTTVPAAAGNYVVRATVAETDNYKSGTATASFVIAAKTVDTDGTSTPGDTSDDLTVEGVTTSFTYDGENHMPKPSTVKVGETTLTEGTDYEVTYKGKNGETYADVTEAKKAGDYQAVITLKGNYSGTKTIDYTIAPKSLTDYDIEAALSATELTYTGSPQAPTASVKDGDTGLTEGTDFTVSYKDKDGKVTTTKPTEAGTYTVIITGKGNYKDPVEKTFTIKPAKADESDFNDVLPTPNKGADGKDLAYTGQPQELVTAPDASKLPAGYTGIQYGTKGEDGKITWSDTVPTGTDVDSYDVYVKYVGDDDHEDVEITKPVTVAIAKVNPAVEPPTDAAPTYNGSEQTLITPATTSDGTVQYSLSKDGPWSANLPEAIDEGTYSVYYKVVGDKNHNDSEVLGPVTATIKAAEVTSGDITASGIDHTVTYDGTAKTPTPSKVTVPDPSDPTKTVELTMDDYAVTYYKADDINDDGTIKEGAQPIAEPTDAGDYQAVITLTGNYSGSTTVPFTIEPASLTGATMSLSPASGTYNGSAQEPAPTITLEGVTPSPVPTDSYTVTYQKKNAAGEWEPFTGEPTDAGEYKVIATGKPDSNFKDSVEQTFTIAKADPTVTTDPTAKTGLTYTGAEQELINPASTTDGTVYYSIGKNGPWTTTPPKATDQGSYDVYWYVEGDANHNDKGSKTEPNGPVTTTIGAKTVDNDGNGTPDDPSDDLTVTGVNDEYTYNGSDQKPTPVVKVGGTTLVVGTDYTVKYLNSDGTEVADTTDAGAYKVVIEFKGNYSGSKEISYDIARAKLADASDVTISPESSQVYNGSEMSPVPTVELNSTTTVPADDYDVKYYKASDFDDTTGQPKDGATPVTPKEAGDYRVFISAKDSSTNYQGSTVVPFTIDKAKVNENGELVDGDGNPISDPETGDPKKVITSEYPSTVPVYDGTDHKPVIKDAQSGVTLEENVDYTVTYWNKSDLDANGQPKSGAQPTTAADAGEKVAFVTLKGDYDGVVRVELEVAKRPVTFTGETGTKAFTGALHELTTVTPSTGTDEGLLSGHTDNVEYSAKGTKAGTHASTGFTPAESGVTDDTSSVTITAATSVVIKNGDQDVTHNYAITTKTGTLTIEAAPVDTSKMEVSFANAEPTYDGTEQKPAATVKIPNPANPDELITLTEGVDFEVTWPADTTNVGEKTPTITLKGNYSGSKNEDSYTVKPASISSATVRLSPTSPQTFNNLDQPNTPTVVLYALNSENKTVPANSYNVTYQMKNPETGEYEAVDVPKAAGDYKVVITAKDTADNNFKGSVTADFKIEPKAIDTDDIQVTFAQDEITYSGNENKPTVTVKVPNPANPSETITLTEGVDFEVTYPDDTTNVGDKTPKITLIGSYSGEREADTYKVTPATLTVTTPSDVKTYDGQPLKKSDGAAIAGLQNGETATLKVTGSITHVADNAANNNTYEIVWDGTAKQANYEDVTKAADLGSLIINKATVQLKSASFEREYDGTWLDNSSVDDRKTEFDPATMIGEGYPTVEVAGRFGFAEGEGATITFTGKQKVVGVSENKFDYELKSNTAATDYTIADPQFGTLNVKNRNAKYKISVVANSDTVTYDGQKHSVAGVKLDGTNTELYVFTVYGNTYTVSGLTTDDPKDKTEAGTYDNNITGTAVVTDSEGDVVTDQFAVSTTNGSLVIKKAAVNDKGQLVDPETGQTINDSETGDPIVVVSVTVPDLDGEGSYVYDGTEHSPVVKDETTGNALVRGNDCFVRYYPNGEGDGVRTVKDVGAYTIKVTFDPTSNFTGTLVSSVKITPRPVTLKSDDATKIYDGQPLTAKEQYNVSDISEGADAGLVSDEDFVYSITGTQTEAGESDNNFTVTGGKDGTSLDNYRITRVAGKLTVKQAKVAQDPDNPGNMILVNEDGDPIDQDGNVLPEGADPVVMSTIESDDNAETAPVYDGTDHKPVVKDNKTGEPLEEGTDYTITWYDKNGNPIDPQSDGPINAGEKTAKITFLKDFGGEAEVTMIVNKRPVTFTGTDQEATYNGSKQSFGAWTDTTAGQTDKGLVSGHKATLTYTAEGTKAGAHTADGFTPKVSGVTDDTSKVEITAPAQVTIADKNGVDRTPNYEITTVTGTLTITQKSVTDPETGEIAPVIDPETGNPVIDPETGKPKPVVGITGTDGDSAPKYDGEDHKPIVVDNTTGKTLVEGTDYDLTYYEANEDGSPNYDKPITGEDAARNAGDKVAVITFKGDFTGTLTAPADVAKRKVTLTSASGEKYYDGWALTKNEQSDVTVGGEGFVNGQGATYAITGSQRVVGSSDNKFTYTLNEGTKADNYTITKTEGMLTVKSRVNPDDPDAPGAFQITVKGKDLVVTYDGQEHVISGFKSEGDVTYDNEELKYVHDGLTFVIKGLMASVRGISAGVYTNAIKGKAQVLDSDNQDVTEQFKVSTVDGELTIEKAGTKDNGDGTGVLTDKDGNPVDKDGNKIAKDPETGNYYPADPDDPTKPDKTKDPVEPVKTVTVSDPDDGDAPVYNGEDHKPTVKDELSGKTLKEGEDYDIVWLDADGNEIQPQEDGPKNAGDKTAKIVFRPDSNFTGTIEIPMTVAKRPVTFTGDSFEKTYTGSELFYDTYKLTDGSLVEGHAETLTYEVSGTKAGTYDGTITDASGVTIKDGDKDVTANYDITTVAGTLTINAKGIDEDGDGKPDTITDPETGEEKPVVSVTAPNGEDAPAYDGTEHAPTVVDNMSGKTLEQGTDYVVDYYKPSDIDPATGLPKPGAKPLNTTDPTADDYAFDAGEYVAVITFTGDLSGSTSTPITINRRIFHVITESASKDYDGTELTAPTPRVWVQGEDGVPEDAGLLVGQTVQVRVTGGQTAAGSSDNTYEIRFSGEKAYTASDVDGAKSVRLLGSLLAKAATRNSADTNSDGLADKGTAATAKRKNYSEVAELGTLKVRKAKADDGRVEVTPIGKGGSGSNGPDTNGGSTATYSGQPIAKPVLYDNGAKDENGNPKRLVEGTDYTVTYYDENGDVVENPTDAGTYRMVVTYMGDYEGSFSTELTIDKAPLRVSTPSAEKAHDGKPLTNDKGASLTGLVNGETATLKVTGSQTKVGSSQNGYLIAWDGTAKEANYEVVEEDLGTLTVTAAAAPAKPSPGGRMPKTGDPAAGIPLPLIAGSGLGVLAVGLAFAFLRRRKDEDEGEDGQA